MKMFKKGTILFFSLIISLVSIVSIPASSYLSQGEKFFLENQPRKALPLFEAALNEEPQNEKLYLYLGIVYEQLNDLDKSTKILRRGLNVATSLKDVLYFNIGNNLFKQKQFALAEDMYTQAIRINKQIPEAYLNRANARIELKNYKGSISDYTVYMQLKPKNNQRAQIEKLINILNGLIAAAKQKKEEELAKQEALMNDVLNSLKNASEDTKNLSAGSESIKENYEDIDIQD